MRRCAGGLLYGYVCFLRLLFHRVECLWRVIAFVNYHISGPATCVGYDYPCHSL